MGRPNLFGMGSDALAAVIAELGEPAYRARQLYGWLYARRAREIAAMANLPRALRRALTERHDLRWPEVSGIIADIQGPGCRTNGRRRKRDGDCAG
jgi:23S rRNA (adenine2503-C2)-methyltransferase